MEALFSTSIYVDNADVNYSVVFENEAYTFHAGSDDARLSTFSLKREHDEWQAVGDVPPAVSSQAITALDNFLLQQH